MKTRILIPLAAALALLVPTLSTAKDRHSSDSNHKQPWIHVEVLENGQDGAKVHVNLPLSLCRTAINMAGDDVLSDHHVRIEDSDFTVSDLRDLWQELKKAGDAEYVTVEEDGQTVRVYREKERVFAIVEGGDEGSVHVEVPVSLVDALLSGNEDELDLEAAVAELEKMGSGEIVRVEDGKDLVRVWIE